MTEIVQECPLVTDRQVNDGVGNRADILKVHLSHHAKDKGVSIVESHGGACMAAAAALRVIVAADRAGPCVASSDAKAVMLDFVNP